MLLEELEHVDHILEEQGVSLVKIDSPDAAEKFSVDIIPGIVHFQVRRLQTLTSLLQFKSPHMYKGDLTNEKKIVEWVLGIRQAA